MINDIFKNINNIDDWNDIINKRGVSINSPRSELMGYSNVNVDDFVQNMMNNNPGFSGTDIDHIRQSIAGQKQNATELLGAIQDAIELKGMDLGKNIKMTPSSMHDNLRFASVVGPNEGMMAGLGLTTDQVNNIVMNTANQVYADLGLQNIPTRVNINYGTGVRADGNGSLTLGSRTGVGDINVNFDNIMSSMASKGIVSPEEAAKNITNTVAHEMRHQWQQHYDNAAYRKDIEGYIDAATDFSGYYEQAIEKDARAYGQDFADRYAKQYYDQAMEQFPKESFVPHYQQDPPEPKKGFLGRVKDKISGFLGGGTQSSVLEGEGPVLENSVNTGKKGNAALDKALKEGREEKMRIPDDVPNQGENFIIGGGKKPPENKSTASPEPPPQQSGLLELPAPREGAPMFEGGAEPYTEPPKKKSKFGKELERKRRAEERQERIAESLKEENKKEITEKILTSNHDRNKVRARLYELEQAGKTHTKEYRELVSLEDKARENFQELKEAKQQITDIQVGKDTVIQLPPPQQPDSSQQSGPQRRKGNQPRQSPNPRRAPQPKPQPQPTPQPQQQPQPQPQQPPVKQQPKQQPKQQRKGGPQQPSPQQQQTQQQPTPPPNQQQQQPYGPPPPPLKNYATVDDSSVIEKMFDGDGYSGNIKNGYVQDITISGETFNIKTNAGDGSIDIFDSTGNLIMDTDLEKQINEKVFDETSKFYRGLTDEEWDTAINNAENFRFNANQASESLLERDAKMLNMNDAINYKQKVLEEEREAIKKTAENTKGKKNKKKLSDQRNQIDIKWNEAERIKQINKHKVDSSFRRTAARDKFNKTLGLDAYEAGSDEFKQALNALKGTDEYNAAMKVFKKDLKDINTIKRAGIKETNRVIDAKIKGLTGKGLTLSNAITIGSAALGAVNKYKESRAEGKGMVSSAARAGATAIAAEVMGPATAVAVMGARALGNAAVEAGDMLYKESRRMNSMSNFTPLGGVNFQDSQELATMRQSGMELAKMSQYNLEQTLMGAEAKHLHR